MADVTGSIQGADGEKGIVLNNAATEATLRLLLQSSLASNKQNLDQLRKLAKDGGIFDGAAMSSVNDSMGKLSPVVQSSTSILTAFEQGLYKARSALAPFDSALSKLSQGTAKTSDIMMSFSQMPFGIGMIANAFGRLAKFQEDNMESYQKLTQTGVNFGGSLTEVRHSMDAMYLTMDQFNRVIADNSTTFARLGGTVDQGAKAFVKMSSDLNNSEAGDYLKSLGYSAEEVSQGLAKTLSISGTSSRMDLEGRKQLLKSTVDYMEELDKLTKFTGASRKQVEEEDKKASLNAAYQRKLQSVGVNEAQKIEAMRSAMALTGVKGFADLVMSSFLGLPPATKEAEQAMGLFGGATSAINDTVNVLQNSNSTMQDLNTGFAKIGIETQQGSKSFGDGVLMFGGEIKGVANSAVLFANLLTSKGITGLDDFNSAMQQTGDAQGKQAKSEATEQVEMQKKLFQARAQLNEAISKLANETMPYIKKVLDLFTDAVKFATGQLSKAPEGLIGKFIEYAIYLGVAYAGLKVLGGGSKLVGGRLFSGSSAAETVTSSRIPNSAVRSGAGGAIEGELAGASRGASGLLKGLGIAGTALMMGLSAKEYFDLEKKRKQGEITDENASREKSKIVGETGGGLTGAVSLAAAGSVFGPLGTIVGGIVGGIAGSKIGKDIAESLNTEDKKKVDTKLDDAVKTDAALPQDTPSKDLLEGVNRLNTTMISLLKYMKDTASNTERTYKDVGNLKGKVW